MPESPVLRALAQEYERTRAGRTGKASRNDHLAEYEELLKAAGAQDGDERICAEHDLDSLDGDLLFIEKHPRTGYRLQVRFPLRNEARLYSLLGRVAPAQYRAGLAACFEEAKSFPVPGQWQAGWISFCQDYGQAAAEGGSLQPFDRQKMEETREILSLLPSLLDWKGTSLMRFSSALLCGQSKRLEQLQRKLESCLKTVTTGRIASLGDLGIVPNDRSLLLHGPLTLELNGTKIQLHAFSGPIRISAKDLEQAVFYPNATRCLTVENAAMLHELAKANSGLILASSGSEGGFANSAVVNFLRKLPMEVDCFHFGDSDPKGFDILRDLRERTGRPLASLHMKFRDHADSQALSREDLQVIERLQASPHLEANEKAELVEIKSAGRLGRFEQESLGIPKAAWPFF